MALIGSALLHVFFYFSTFVGFDFQGVLGSAVWVSFASEEHFIIQ